MKKSVDITPTPPPDPVQQEQGEMPENASSAKTHKLIFGIVFVGAALTVALVVVGYQDVNFYEVSSIVQVWDYAVLSNPGTTYIYCLAGHSQITDQTRNPLWINRDKFSFATIFFRIKFVIILIFLNIYDSLCKPRSR